ncbi:MAG TPA: hypothetical protein VGW38_00865 [Chloroflexota bacterium]|nr:hypothetical protein [Chloroflexota bacterium]
MEPNLTAHYLGLATDNARLSRQAERGWLVEQVIATQPRRAGTLAAHRWGGAVLTAVVGHPTFVLRQLFTHVHSARQAARS